MSPRCDTFAGRGGVLHGDFAAPPPLPSSGPHILDDTPPIYPEQEEDTMSLEEMIADYRNRLVPMIDPALEGAIGKFYFL